MSDEAAQELPTDLAEVFTHTVGSARMRVKSSRALERALRDIESGLGATLLIVVPPSAREPVEVTHYSPSVKVVVKETHG